MRERERATVLLAEDDEDVRTVFAMVLSESYDIVAAENARQAVELARTHRPDVVLLDWTLPDADGEDVIRRLRALDEQGPVPPIVIVSGSSAVGALAKRFDAIACPKPCDADQLVAAIERALQRKG